MVLKLFNTMSRKKETVKPLEYRLIRMYTCGPTVYNYVHVGNLRTYVNEDLLKRYLLRKGFQVKHVMNITDVGHLTDDADQGEDKMVVAERREGKNAWEIAKFYENAFLKDAEQLNVLVPDVLCRATDHIKEQIALVQTLEKKGFTYIVKDGVYFDTSKLTDYGKLARLKLKDLKAGARVEVAEGKRNPADFALWKFTPKGVRRHMEWDSPWGKGFPGWHIECSAMAMKYLGETFDLHAGGIDHIPVHHTNEIAQSEAATDKPFARYWFHCEFLTVGEGAKMAKSAGNFLSLQTIIDEGFSPDELRFFYLTAHYRTQQTFTLNNLRSAAQTLDKLNAFIARLISYRSKTESNTTVKKLVAKLKQDFEKAMDDDLNTPIMWAALHTFTGHINKFIETQELSESDAKLVHAILMEFNEVWGVLAQEAVTLTSEAKKLIEEREKTRKEKRFKESDLIRKKLLEEFGIEVQDTPDGPKARFVKKR